MNSNSFTVDDGVIRGLHMNHFVLTSKDGYEQHRPHQYQLPQMPQAPSEEFTEVLMLDNSRKSCTQTTLDDVGYLCGCGPSPLDQVEVVYVKRNPATTPSQGGFEHPNDVYSSNFSGNFSPKPPTTPSQGGFEHRDDVYNSNFSGNFSHRMHTEEYRDGIHADPFQYSSPRVGCMPATMGGFVDMFMMPGCKPKHFFNDIPRKNNTLNDKKSKEKKARDKNDEKSKLSDEEKNVKYDEWKKQFVDLVKVPSFHARGLEVSVDEYESGPSLHQSQERKAASQPQVTSVPSDSRTGTYYRSPANLSSGAALHSRQEYQETQRSYQPPDARLQGRTYADSGDLARLRSEQETLRSAREALQSELEEFKRRHGNSMASAGGLKVSTEDTHRNYMEEAHRRQIELKELMVNQKFNEVMSAASPRSTGGGMGFNIVNEHMNDGMSGRVPPSPLIQSQNWNSDVRSPIGGAYLPTSPAGMNFSNALHSPNANASNLSHFEPFSPSGMNGNYRSFNHGASSHGWSGSSTQHPTFDRGFDTRYVMTSYIDKANENDNEEKLIQDLRTRNAYMEMDLMKMKERMSPRFQPVSPRFASSPTSSVSGILRPSSYHNSNYQY